MRILRPLFVLLVCSRCAAGQDFNYIHYDVKDGLAGSVVYCAAEDREGFLWFGTEAGLSRFDGTHFKNFTTVDGLPDNEVLKLFVDSKNRVWMIPFKSAVCYYWKGKIYNKENDSLLRRLSIGAVVYSISEDREGNILIIELDVIHVIYPSGQVKEIRFPGAKSGTGFVKGAIGRDGQFYVFINSSSGWRIGRLVSNRDHSGVTIVKDIFSRHNANRNAILVSPDYFITLHGKKLLYYSLAGRSAHMTIPLASNSLSLINDTIVAVNTTSGTFTYNVQTRRQIGHFLIGQSVNDIITDTEGNTWFMSAGSGVFRLGSTAFRNIRLMGRGAGQSVSCVRKIDGTLFIGTEKSLCRADPQLEVASVVPVRGQLPLHRRIVTIDKVDKDSLLLGMDEGLASLRGTVLTSSPVGESIKCAVRLNNSTWLVSSGFMVYLLQLPGFRVTDIILMGRSTCSYKKDSIYFVGTLDGLIEVLPDRRHVSPGDTWPIFNSRIADIKETSDGILWVATYGQGIAAYGNGRLLYRLTEKDGLSSNICRTLAVSGNELWVGTDKGISRVRRKDNSFEVTRFSTAEGLKSDMINTLCVDGGNVFVGTAQGLTYFNANYITGQSYCKLRITSVQTSRHVWMYDTSHLVLPHKENSIRVDFVGISFRSAGNIEYRYRLQGLSDAWHTTRETFVSYPTLPSGAYTLELIAVNKFGVHSHPIQVEFMVEKQLQEKAWFIVLVAALAGALIWLLLSMRIRYIKKLNQEKLNTNARITELEHMALKAQMNPHFIFNSLNSIQQYMMERDFKGVNKFITDFSRLIRLTLEISSRSRISLEEEVKYLSTYLELERARFENMFTYQVELGPGVDSPGFQIPPMILQPYVENSIRHGVRNRDDNDGKITITFVKEEPYLVCTVEDNGVGRSAAEKFKGEVPIEYQSRGMALTASRVEMINQSHATAIRINIEDMQTSEGQAAGTRVIIRFPLQTIIKPTSILYDQSPDNR